MSKKSDFLSFYNKNINISSASDYTPNIKKWYDKVEDVHNDIRDQIGGETATYKIETRLNSGEILEGSKYEEASGIGTNIRNLIPDYFGFYGFYPDDLSLLTVPRGSQKGMEWSKHISYWMNRNVTSDETKRLVNIELSKLGVLYAEHKNVVDMELYIHISTQPMHFAMLGHSGLDTMSCFNNSSVNPVHKLIIGQTKDSFICLISQSQDINEYDKHLSRLWGVLNLKDGMIVMSNRYNSQNHYKIYSKVDYNSLLEHIAKQIFKTEKIYKISNTIITNGVWQNKDTLGYSIKQIENNDDYKIDFDSIDLDQYRKCISCRRCANVLYPAEGGQRVCENCKPLYRLCELSHVYTNCGLSPVYISESEVKLACSSALRTMATKCKFTRLFFLKELCVKNIDNYFMNKFWAAKNGYEKCSNCDYWIYADSKKCVCDTLNEKKELAEAV